MFWEWGGRTVSRHPHVHSTNVEPHDGQGTKGPFIFILPLMQTLFSLHSYAEHSRTSNSRPHAGTILRPLSSRTSILLCWNHIASGELCVFTHDLLCCCGLPYVLGWESSHFTHSLEVGIFLFLSVVYVCFSLPIRGLYICLPLPSCECGFPFHPRNV